MNRATGLAIIVIALAVTAYVSAPALAQNTPCYSEQGGASVIAGAGCVYQFLTGSEVSFASEPEFTGGAKFGDVAGGNYTEIDQAGTVLLHGDATVWDDIRIPATSTKNGGSKDPDFAVWKTNGAGSQGVFVHYFDASIEEELYFSLQLPHEWKIGTDLSPHIHWAPATNGSAGQVVDWGLECNWTNIGGAAVNTTILFTNTTVQAPASLVAGTQYLTDMGDISGTGKTISSMLMCRVFRDAAGALATDNYPGDAALLEIDFHYEIDSLGSTQLYTK